MPYKTIDCKCGTQIEVFISQAVESDGTEDCSKCGRTAMYKSPPEDGITDVDFRREIGDVGS